MMMAKGTFVKLTSRRGKIANIAMYYLDYYKEVGGIDCRFEHVNMNCNDLAFRIQAAGGKIYPSPDIVIKQTNISTKNESVHRLPIGMTIKKTPKEGLPAIERAYHENDYPLFYNLSNIFQFFVCFF